VTGKPEIDWIGLEAIGKKASVGRRTQTHLKLGLLNAMQAV
jgi:hypothetical protein